MTKVKLSPAREIPFNKLELSSSNVRTRVSAAAIEQLAEDIARRGLLQSLSVRTILDNNGEATDRFEVQAGGRRYRALTLLVNSKRLAKTTAIPCIVHDDGIAEEDSLVENVQRADLTPIEQFRAFQALIEKGRSEAEIAASFFVSLNVVQQRLRLARVAPLILEAYENEDISLEMLQAFAATEDQDRQIAVFEWLMTQNSYSRYPDTIRRRLTETSVRSNDKRVRFVGLDVYEARGGTTERDLFTEHDNIFLTNPALLETIVMEKLREQATIVAAEGWKWIDAAISINFIDMRNHHQITGSEVPLSENENARISALETRVDDLYEQYAEYDEWPDDVADELSKIDAELDELKDRPRHFDDAERAHAGCYISIDPSGNLDITRGLVKPEDLAALNALYASRESGDISDDGPDNGTIPETEDSAAREEFKATIQIGGRPDVAEIAEGDDSDTLKPLSEQLRSELSATHTIALQNAVAEQPSIALNLLLHRLSLDCFYIPRPETCLEARIASPHFRHSAEDLGDLPFATASSERDTAWKAILPDDEDDLWPTLERMSDSDRMALLAHLVSRGVNAVYEKRSEYDQISPRQIAQRLSAAQDLAARVNLDLAASGWRPTVANYFGRVSKAHIVEAVREACGEQAVQLICNLKKADMAREAERLVEPTDWVPAELRTTIDASAIDDDQGSDDTDLPDFLAGDDEDETSDPDDELQSSVTND